ncbi:FeoA domain protein [Pseudoramibacter alactolyticus ATCC 23263]|uniref:FeoA domain protein n=2 Tax=Eubacteriaceae TaxID=186806 RepID=E6MGU8_9FIRM|nr:FeoA domain protein [Pseudoramibacter alactolyticus ATCC 23263]
MWCFAAPSDAARCQIKRRSAHEKWKEEREEDMPLSLADLNTEYQIKFIRGKDEVIKHMNDLGFVLGATVKPIQKLGGNLIVQIKESRVAIDKSMADKIIV